MHINVPDCQSDLIPCQHAFNSQGFLQNFSNDMQVDHTQSFLLLLLIQITVLRPGSFLCHLGRRRLGQVTVAFLDRCGNRNPYFNPFSLAILPCFMFSRVCVECLIGKQKKPILFKVTEPSSIPVTVVYSWKKLPQHAGIQAQIPELA